MTLAGRLTVDLAAIAANWRALDRLSGPDVDTAAVVKADAYGLGAAMVVPTLADAGARTFFVALPHEGVRLREALGPRPTIYILAGYAPADCDDFYAADLRPVINSLEQAQAWFQSGPARPAALQLDSGMNRLGLEAADLDRLRPLPDGVALIMSHLACSDDRDHPQNAAQLAAFREMTRGLGVPLSLAATGGTLLGRDYHFALTRPGIGLYGGMPFAEARPAVTLEIPIIQIRDVAPGEAVGYGATWTARAPARIATISAGYADGLIRAMGNRAAAWLDGEPLPFAGRVSMDLITLDVTRHASARPGAMVELLGADQGIDDLAHAAGTIGYEVLTALGSRYARRYLSG